MTQVTQEGTIKAAKTPAENPLQQQIHTTAFGFRGYNVTNLGKTPELLNHPAYGPIVERYLNEASDICADTLHRRTDLVTKVVSRLKLRRNLFDGRTDIVARVRRRGESSIATYAQDLALIVAAELAEIKLLEEFFGVKFQESQLAFGYSLGEIAALVACGVYELEAVLKPVLAHADDAAELGKDVRLGVLFSRGPALDFAAVRRLCLQITSEGNGVIAISTYLSPNTVLLMGQGDTIDRFGQIMHESLPEPAHLRKNPHNWPPMHTPITWQRCIPNRVGVMIGPARGGFTAPKPPILSCVTGAASYTDVNSRELMVQWVDHPQRVWDVVDKILAAGVETVIHVGPEPNILPATFTRLANNVTAQLSGRSFASMGLRAVSRIVRRPRPWLTSRISSDATLLRAPFVKQIVLEDWLLEQQPK